LGDYYERPLVFELPYVSNSIFDVRKLTRMFFHPDNFAANAELQVNISCSTQLFLGVISVS